MHRPGTACIGAPGNGADDYIGRIGVTLISYTQLNLTLAGVISSADQDIEPKPSQGLCPPEGQSQFIPQPVYGSNKLIIINLLHMFTNYKHQIPNWNIV